MAERRPSSRESCRQSGRKTESAFAAFLSDGSDDEDADDADTRALLRMQQQADDSAYSDAPFKAEPQVADSDVSVSDVLDLVALVERASRVVDGHVDVNKEEVGDSESQSPRRKTSIRETESAFADFVSDSSEEEDEDDADTRALLRMQQQADDRTYVDTLKMDPSPTVGNEESSNSFRLTWAKPGVFDAREDESLMGPRKLVEGEMAVDEFDGQRDDAVDAADPVEAAESDQDDSFVDGRPSFSDANSFTGGAGSSFVDADADVVKHYGDHHDSLASRPPSFDDEGDSFFDEPRPSFSDEHSFTGGDSFTDNSFVYRPSLPDDEENQGKVLDHVHDSFVDTSFVYRPSLPRVVTQQEVQYEDTRSTDATIASAAIDNSFVYRPDSEESTQKTEAGGSDGVDNIDEYRPTLSDNDDETQVVDDNDVEKAPSSSPATADDIIYRPTLPDDDVPEIVFGYTHSASTNTSTTEECSFGYRPGTDDKITHESTATDTCDVGMQEESRGIDAPPSASSEELEQDDEPSFLSPSASSFIRSSDAVAFSFGDIDSSFRLHEVEPSAVATESDSFSSVLTDSCASNAPPKLDTTTHELEADNVTIEVPTAATAVEQHEDKAAPLVAATALNPLSAPSTDASIKPLLSRKSSAASSTGSSSQECFSQRRMTATRESWRVSSLGFRESKHAFDEELGPLVNQPQSPRAPAVNTEQHRQRLSSTFEERASAASSSSNSFASFHSQANFFVDDFQQSFESVSSLSLDSRPSGDDSFSNVAILGDDGRDQNERRSSDIISQDVDDVPETLDRSYSDLVAVTTGLDRSFSELVDRGGFYRISANESANGTSLGSSLASTTSDELTFASFNVAKPPPSRGPVQQPKLVENKDQRSPATARQQPTKESQQVFYRSFVLPRGSDVKAVKRSAVSSAYSTGTQSFSSAALLAAIKTRDARTNTRSEETEAGDVACGALPHLEPPLKLNVGPRGRGSLSPSLLSKSGAGSISASPLAVSSMNRSSVASSTGTADRLDFTGVYRGSANSLEASHDNGAPSEPAQPQDESKMEKHKDALKFELLAVKLERSISDSRMMQHESQRKVEEFFRKTYQKSVDDIDEREVHRWTNRKTRARTTVIQCVDDAEKVRGRFNGDKVAKIIDLKNLRNGGKQPGWHLEDDAPLTPQREDSSKQGALGMTTGTTSTGTTATRSMPSDLIHMPPNYVISPQAADSQKPKVLVKRKKGKGAKAADGNRASRFGAMSGRRADNLSLTPTLPRLSANESPAFSPSPFVSSFTASNGFGASDGIGIGRSPGKSPVAFAGTATGFLWKANSGFNGLKRSADAPFDASQVSYAQRSTLAGRVQSLSASLASTLRRFLPGRNAQPHTANAALTSPQSQCTAPAALPRAYDQDGFYEAPFKVPGLNKPLEQRRKEKTVESDRAWVRQWLILATCAVLGLSLGAILVRVVMVNATVFNLSADEVHESQDSNGEMVVSTGVRWLLLPGHLFLRVWAAVTTVLLVCYVSTGLADLVGCADKAALVLSFRSIGYAIVLAVLAALEGVFAMWMTHSCGFFRGDSGTTSAEASTLADAMGVTPVPNGAVGLLCTGDGEYLQRLGHNVFACSNASLLLPLYEEVPTNSTGIADSGPAVFALQEVTTMLATPMSVPYYPASLDSGGKLTISLLSALTPSNVASQFTQVELDEVASLGGLLVFGLLLGYVCGKRILSLRRDGQAAMFESIGSAAPDPHKSRHYIVGILMELQLVLEWMVRPMERYLAPLGFFSLSLGHVVTHHREWRSFTSPMSSLVVGVLILILLHAGLVLPIILRQFSSSRRLFPFLTTIRAFVPAFLFAFTTDNVALTAPVTMQCYARVNSVTRSAAQLATAVTAALTRNARALYLPLLVLWLLETSSSEDVVLSTTDYFSVGLVSLLSSFCGGSSRLTLAMARTLWSIAASDRSPNAASLLPATMPLLVVCDVILSRVANVMTVTDHVVLTQLVAQHWDETVVEGPPGRNNDNNNYVASPSPLDDSQVPRPSSSAMLSSVYL
ncbi:hypothetical protein PC129_g16179 [Phytophthora cactorum]|uniref:Transmembrane protein n=1 Tax=Phytophthora cactorum TaxID=29920 RepID=A0A329SA01_9STRA|nr:hypothetical protein Pcac1_g27432 [Phytophthora cactorum]KAG2806831.1 hypothetical protein PC112_g17670 [Phytophthora cactorum]KAG2808470.1 hypothetical protein PC111_g16473 [Phytophthora cactorum]KAG2848290.1 hypothetical protein PC113_g17617 [Phytophthora cactorum]KAG2886485.1 hypothetical protein PC114_g19224 [Phytophthora cactorum]